MVILNDKNLLNNLSGMVGRISAFQLGGQGSIPGGVKDFNLYPGTECVSFVFCPVFFGSGPDVLLTTDPGRPAFVYLSSVLVLVCATFRLTGGLSDL